MDKLRERAYGFLRWTEKYTKTDMVYAASGGFWLFFGQAATAAFSLLLAIAFANLIEPEKYGNYKYILSLAGIIGVLTLTGLGTVVTRAVARKHEGTLRYAFRMSLMWSAGMILVALAGGSYYLLQGNQLLGFSLFIIGAVSPIIASASLYRPFLMGKREFRRVGLFGILQTATPSLSVLAAILLHAPLLALIAVYFITSAATVWLLYKKTEKLIENNDVDPITDHLGKHLSVMGIMSTITGKLDSILVFQLLGGAELAIFSLAITIPDTIRGSLKNITALATPKFAQKEKGEIKDAIWKKTKTVFLMTVLITLAYMVAAPFIFQIFFPKYLESVAYSQVYALTLITSLVLASAYFDSQAAVKERYILNIANNVITVVTVVVGIFLFGIWGAIGARIIARVINMGLSALLISRH